MRAVNYLKNRFQTSLQYKKPIYVNQNDVNALNNIIEHYNKKEVDTELEDSLLLFYLFWTYSIENENNIIKLKQKPVEQINFPLGINTPYNVLNKISKLLEPKSFIIQKIVDEIWFYQEYERVCKNQELRNKEIEEGNYYEDKDGIRSYYVTKQETVPIEKKSTYEEVENILNEAIKKCKTEFPMISYLKGNRQRDEILNSLK